MTNTYRLIVGAQGGGVGVVVDGKEEYRRTAYLQNATGVK